jgi:putative hydrolase of the HAD superfamily
MIRAVIFDCFGVLAVEGWLPLKEKYFGNDREKFTRATNLMRQCDSGLLDYHDFMQAIATLAGISVDDVRLQIERNPPNAPLFAYIRTQLKPHYKIGLLSNAAANRLDELFTPEQQALFDAVALSFETGVPKPDPRAYAIIAGRLGVPPEACVFVDDQEHYCTAARNASMQAVVYHNFGQTKTALQKLLEENIPPTQSV